MSNTKPVVRNVIKFSVAFVTFYIAVQFVRAYLVVEKTRRWLYEVFFDE